MKALSIKQPWANLIIEGKKTIEVRTWNTKFSGEFLNIHLIGDLGISQLFTRSWIILVIF